MVSDSKAAKEEGSIDFMFRKFMKRFCLMRGVGVSMSMIRARWSEMVEPRSVLVRLLVVIPVVQIRSRVCPFLWVGK